MRALSRRRRRKFEGLSSIVCMVGEKQVKTVVYGLRGRGEQRSIDVGESGCRENGWLRRGKKCQAA